MKSVMGRLSFVFALVLVCLTPAPLSADFVRLMRSVRPIQFVSEQGELQSVCTTTAIGDGYHWLTAAHCTTSDAFIVGERAAVVFRDEDLDLAVLKTVATYAEPRKVQKSAPYIAQRITMLGYPGGLAAQFFQGHISGVATVNNRLFMMFDMAACGGDSGSAVVNSHDEIVSVLQIGFGRPCSSFSGGALWHDVAYVVARYGFA